MANNTKRILSDHKEIIDSHNKRKDANNIYNYVDEVWNPSENVWCYFDQSNIRKMKALIIGTEKTPYEYGYYFFDIEFPDMFPLKPPTVKSMTQDPSGKWRKNPNLYICGKVCLSMINTWSGPGWVPTNTILTVLVAIQALVMHEQPLKNEPGYETANKTTLNAYNNYCFHENYRVGVNYMLTNTVSGFEIFKPVIEYLFLQNYPKIKEQLEDWKQKMEGQSISCAYNMNLKCNFTASLTKSAELYKSLHTKYEFAPLSDNGSSSNSISTKEIKEIKEIVSESILLTDDMIIYPSNTPIFVPQQQVFVPASIVSDDMGGSSSQSEEKGKRKAPSKPAKCYDVGYEKVSENDSSDVIYIVTLRKDGVKYWKKIFI
jgi:ubiquitin-protein ligase